MTILARLNLIKAYTSRSRQFPLSLRDLLAGVTKPPCTVIGPRYVEWIRRYSEEYVLVKIKQLKRPLCWPVTFPMFDLYKVITESFYESDWHFYEVPDTRVEQGDVVLDCGGAEGLFTLRVCDRASRVAIFEPLSVFVKSLQITFKDCTHVEIVPCALGADEGEAFFEGGSLYGHITSKFAASKVAVSTIDAWARRHASRVDYIKGDLEGCEMDVLKGAKQVISQYRPKIAITMYHATNDWKEALDLVRSLVPSYQYRIKGLAYSGGVAHPVMLHMWCPK